MVKVNIFFSFISRTDFPSVCPISLDPFYIVSFCIKWIETSWTYSIFQFSIIQCSFLLKIHLATVKPKLFVFKKAVYIPSHVVSVMLTYHHLPTTTNIIPWLWVFYRPTFSLFLSLSLFFTIFLSVFPPPLCLTVCLSVSLSVCLSVSLSVSLSVCLSLSLFLTLYVCLSVSLSHLFIFLSLPFLPTTTNIMLAVGFLPTNLISLSISLSKYIFHYFFFSLSSLSLSLSVSLSLSHLELLSYISLIFLSHPYFSVSVSLFLTTTYFYFFLYLPFSPLFFLSLFLACHYNMLVCTDKP